MVLHPGTSLESSQGTSSSILVFADRILPVAAGPESAAPEFVRTKVVRAVDSAVETPEMLALETAQLASVETEESVAETELEIAAGIDSGMGTGFHRGMAVGFPGTLGTIALDLAGLGVGDSEQTPQHRDAEVSTVRPAYR